MVERIHHERSSTQGLTTLIQQFRFADTEAAAVVNVLLTAPLVGDDSVFGKRPGSTGPHTGTVRTLNGFSPAPGFRFDVEMTHVADGVFLVEFSQPERTVPYLQGGFVWTVTEAPGGAMFDEQINTERAFQTAAEPLTGPKPSLRRWLFFRVGHQQVMAKATKNIAALLAED